jgi:ribosome-associated protein
MRSWLTPATLGRIDLVHSKDLAQFAEDVLDDMKAKDTLVLDVGRLTSITDYMIIATGTSGRHVRSVANRLVEKCKEKHLPTLGIEGLEDANWVLVDLQDVVVHIMQAGTRDFYKLENLWDMHTQTGDASAEPAS